MKPSLTVEIGPTGPVSWGMPLPPGFRPEVSERCIELPLSLAIAVWSPRVLDAGAALNLSNAHKWVPSRFIHVTLGRERRFLHPKRTYITADLRRLPFRDKAFPCAVCVSTLEHIGMDNRHYGHTEAINPESVWAAVRELRRVTQAAVFISVPCGVSEVHPSGQWQAFGADRLAQLEAALQPADIARGFYAREDEGWRLAGPEILTRRAWTGEKTITGLAVIRAGLGSRS